MHSHVNMFDFLAQVRGIDPSSINIGLDLPIWFLLMFLFVLGAVIGSFLNVCVFRIADAHLANRTPEPERLWPRIKWIGGCVWEQLQSLWERPSQCPRCRNDIAWYDNVPIFGWLMLRGRCRQCQMWISPRYPLIELLNGLLFVLVFWFEVPIGIQGALSESCLDSGIGPEVYPGLGWMSPIAFVLIRFAFHMVLIEALLVASLIDLDHKVIPDATTIPFGIFGLIASTALARVHLIPAFYHNSRMLRSFMTLTPEWMHPYMEGPDVPAWMMDHPHLHGFLVSFVGILVGAGITLAVRRIGRRLLGQEAMGDGDVILMGMIGAFLGWQAVVLAFFIGALCALVFVVLTSSFDWNRQIPYGPYLSLGGLITVLGWAPIWDRFGQLLELGVLIIPISFIMTALFTLSLIAVVIIKRIFGISTVMLPQGYWRAADQHWFFSGEKVNRHTGNWVHRDWEGISASRGQVHEDRWRNGTSSNHPSMRSPRKLGD